MTRDTLQTIFASDPRIADHDICGIAGFAPQAQLGFSNFARLRRLMATGMARPQESIKA